MVGFLQLPQKVRDMIYGLVFDANLKLVFVPDLKHGNLDIERHPAAAFLVCSKQIYRESRPTFLHKVRLDVTKAVDSRTGALTLSDNLDDAGNIKIQENGITGDGLKKLFKSLPRLEAFTYQSAHRIHVRPYSGSCSRKSDIGGDLSDEDEPPLINRCVRQSIRWEARAKSQRLLD